MTVVVKLCANKGPAANNTVALWVSLGSPPSRSGAQTPLTPQKERDFDCSLDPGGARSEKQQQLALRPPSEGRQGGLSPQLVLL